MSIACGGRRLGAPGVDIGVLVMTETISMQPIAAGGYGVTRFNALRHGLLSPCCHGRTRANITHSSPDLWPSSAARTDWPVFCSASGGCGWPRPPPTGAVSTALVQLFPLRVHKTQKFGCTCHILTGGFCAAGARF